jgi:hypothetical protein
MRLRLLCGSAILLALCCAPAVAPAAYIQDFDSLQPGTIDGQDQWRANAWDVVQSDTAKSGQALAVTYPSSPRNVTRPFDSAETVGRVRLQMDLNFSATGPSYAGQSNKDARYTLWISGRRDATGDPLFAELTYSGQTGSFGTISKDYFQFSGTTSVTSPALSVQNDTWYHLIFDLNWNGVADLRIENPDGSTLWDPSFVIYTHQHSSPGLLFETSGQSAGANMFVDNLSATPFPEPATAGLIAGVGGVALLGMKRRRRREMQRAHSGHS